MFSLSNGARKWRRRVESRTRTATIFLARFYRLAIGRSHPRHHRNPPLRPALPYRAVTCRRASACAASPHAPLNRPRGRAFAEQTIPGGLAISGRRFPPIAGGLRGSPLTPQTGTARPLPNRRALGTPIAGLTLRPVYPPGNRRPARPPDQSPRRRQRFLLTSLKRALRCAPALPSSARKTSLWHHARRRLRSAGCASPETRRGWPDLA
jgi:hypothetical protein